MMELLSQRGETLNEAPEANLDCLDGSKDECAVLYGLPGSSGGYAEYIFRTASMQIFHKDVGEGPLPFKTLRNEDFKV